MPFSPGGASDLTARTLAQKMGESMGQSIVVDNKPGANGVLGIDSVAKSPPDGYTILLTDRGSLTVNPSLYVKLPYDPIKDFSYIGIATDGPYVLVVNPKLDVKTVQELVALSKSKPGTVNYSSFGIGSMAQLNLEAFNQKMGTDMLHVPYKGASPAAQAVGGGRSRRDHRRGARGAGLHQGRPPARARGRLGQALRGAARRADDDGGRRAATTSWCRPTSRCSHPRARRAPIVAKLNAELKKALADPAVAERLAGAGLVPVGGTPEAMAASVKQDLPRFADAREVDRDQAGVISRQSAVILRVSMRFFQRANSFA